MKKGKIPKIRLDDLLFERGLAESREQAQALILSGTILVGDRPTEKAGTTIPVDAEIRIRGEANPYVSRGGLKLRGALDAFGIPVAGLTAIDIGASRIRGSSASNGRTSAAITARASPMESTSPSSMSPSSR
jgi:ribosomal protein S4